MDECNVLTETFDIEVIKTYFKWERFINSIIIRCNSKMPIYDCASVYLVTFIEMSNEEERKHMFKILTHRKMRSRLYETFYMGTKYEGIINTLFNHNTFASDDTFLFFFKLQRRFVMNLYATYGHMDIYDLIKVYKTGCERYNENLLERLDKYISSMLTVKEKKIIKQRTMEEKLTK